MTHRAHSRLPLLEAIARALAGGVDWIQLREPDLEGRPLLDLADGVLRAARSCRRPARVLVRRRLDVALAAGLDGVHLGFDSLPAQRARRMLPEGSLLGTASHRPGEIPEVEAAHLDYAHLAPIFRPLSKAAERPPLGIEALRAASQGSLPLLAQGGITAENAGDCIAAGAAGVAVTGALLASAEPERAAAALRGVLDAAARARGGRPHGPGRSQARG